MAQIVYPQTEKDNTVDEYFGTKVADPYRWLEDDTSEATARWVEDENKVTNDYLAKIPFRDKLLKRLKQVSDYEKIGTPQSDDILFYQNPAYPKRFYQISVNEDETMAFLIESGEGAGNNLYVRNLKQPGSQFIQMTSDMNYYYFPVETIKNQILIQTNYGAPRGRLMSAKLAVPGIRSWLEMVAESEDVLKNAAVIGDRLLLTYMKDATDHAYVHELVDGKRLHEVTFP